MTEIQQAIETLIAAIKAAVERLRSPPLSHGIARELRKQQAILEREIGELERV